MIHLDNGGLQTQLARSLIFLVRTPFLHRRLPLFRTTVHISCHVLTYFTGIPSTPPKIKLSNSYGLNIPTLFLTIVYISCHREVINGPLFSLLSYFLITTLFSPHPTIFSSPSPFSHHYPTTALPPRITSTYRVCIFIELLHVKPKVVKHSV